MDRESKERVASSLNKQFSESNLLILTHNNGLTVGEITNLRSQLRETDSTLRVTKNSLSKIAISNTQAEVLSDQLNGPIAIVFSKELSSQPKILSNFSKDHENFSIVGGFMEGEIIDKETINTLASLPSFDVLRATLLSMLCASATSLAGILSRPGGKLNQVIYAKSKEDKVA